MRALLLPVKDLHSAMKRLAGAPPSPTPSPPSPPTRHPPHPPPTTLFPSHFGNGSFARHLAEAESAHARVIVRRNPRLEMDVDDEADLRALLEHDLSGTETGRWLRTSGVESRFLPSIRAGAMSAS